MSSNALTMAAGLPLEVMPYGAVRGTLEATRAEVRSMVPGILNAMASVGLVARGAASIEGADGAVVIEIPCDVPRDATTLVEVFASESADTTQPVARARRSPKQ